MAPIITIDNLGKQYKIGSSQSYLTLRDSLGQMFRRKPTAKDKNQFWALKDLSFEVPRGASLGVIGRNGAGKSTLLKILSQITPPTTGKVTLRGRVASLLEVGTGFHPELTGRENIYLNGAILGMARAEIKAKFDEIVDFAGVEQFLDLPVKRYSSGMYVRLAFAVAAHLEPEILIIDEVLAVGDAEFQKKCVGKMEEVTRKYGRTILFVSHNLITVQELCSQTILLENGSIKKMGATKDVIHTYLHERTSQTTGPTKAIVQSGTRNDIRITEATVSNLKGSGTIFSDDGLKIRLAYTSDGQEVIPEVRIVIHIISQTSGQNVLWLDSTVPAESFEQLKPKGEIVCETGPLNLSEGTYFVDVNFHVRGTSVEYIRNMVQFNVTTALDAYNYRIYPDATVCDNVIAYTFKAGGGGKRGS